MALRRGRRDGRVVKRVETFEDSCRFMASSGLANRVGGDRDHGLVEVRTPQRGGLQLIRGVDGAGRELVHLILGGRGRVRLVGGISRSGRVAV